MYYTSFELVYYLVALYVPCLVIIFYYKNNETQLIIDLFDLHFTFQCSPFPKLDR